MSKLYLIAELGVNFYDTAMQLQITPLEAAELYIDKACSAGVDCVKLQAYKADTLASVHSPAYWDLTKEPTASQHELFRKYDAFEESEYRILANYVHSKGMDFMVTPFDDASVEFLYPLVDCYKISSSDISNIPFIRNIGSKRKQVMMSTGASTFEEVDEAVLALTGAGCTDITLMHCVLSYPTRQCDANLRVIESMKKRYPDCRIGYSDHVAPDKDMLTLVTAYSLGAYIIEKHFTLDKTLPGNDHYHAGDPEDFKTAISNIELVETLLGDPEKVVLSCEQMSRRQARRSLVFTRDMKKGEAVCEDDLIAKRPGTGIAPLKLKDVIGRRLNCDVSADDILMEDMLIN